MLNSCGGGSAKSVGGEQGDSSNAPGLSSVTLAWDPPMESSSIIIAGYKVYYGTSSGQYGKVMDVGNVVTYTVQSLSPGTYYFAVTAYDKSGNESSYTNEVSKTIL
ncbi:MAG: fibronectin type III domain-containing protein [Dissulfurispiraceae bacterium]